LARIGVVSSQVLGHYRKYAVMVALILSAIITPDATLFTMLLMAVPLIILYEIGIWGARLFGRRKVATEPEMNLERVAPVGTAGHRVR
jgi:sec-independent protein translocase protein TatC